MNNRKSMFYVLIPALLGAAILLLFFWEPILLQIAPKAVLTSAVSDVFSQLEDRFQGDPLLIIAKSMDPEGKYTADITLEMPNELLGTVNYDMTIQTNGEDHQIFAQGMAMTGEKQVDLSVYLDTEFMAVSSDSLVHNNYYGITYDSFQEDIRSNPLMRFFISNTMLEQWAKTVQHIQDQMCAKYTLPQIPEYTREDVQKLLLGILALPCEIENSSVSVNERLLACKTVSYRASGTQVDELLADTAYSDNAAVMVTFYLHENRLVKIQFKCVSADQSVMYVLNLGENPKEDNLHLQRIISYNETVEQLVFAVDTMQSEDYYSESWSYQKSLDGSSEPGVLSFEYTQSTGAMAVQLNDSAEEIHLILTEMEDGFQCSSNDFGKLIQGISQKTDGNSEEQIPCTLTIRKGSQIEKPSFKNLDKWSLEDFWSLLNGIGALFGIDIAF